MKIKKIFIDPITALRVFTFVRFGENNCIIVRVTNVLKYAVYNFGIPIFKSVRHFQNYIFSIGF